MQCIAVYCMYYFFEKRLPNRERLFKIEHAVVSNYEKFHVRRSMNGTVIVRTMAVCNYNCLSLSVCSAHAGFIYSGRNYAYAILSYQRFEIPEDDKVLGQTVFN